MNRPSVPYSDGFLITELMPFLIAADFATIGKGLKYLRREQEGQQSFKADHLHFRIFLQNLIDGAAFMGVGFDGRGDYSPESRKMSIVQRNCAGKAT